MKTTITMIAGLVALLCTGCEKSNGGPQESTVSPQAAEALMAKYPNAVNVTWQQKGDYFVAEFFLPEARSAAEDALAAWFDGGGAWYMTEKDLELTALPEAVQTAFHAGEYATWQVDDVDKLERQGVETVYVIEVEGRADGLETEMDLYYSSEGTLIKKVADAESDYDYGDYIPAKPADSVQEFVNERYPEARILDIEVEDGMTEVEILDGGFCRELLFDRSGSWLLTKTELRMEQVPETVLQALVASEYASYRIDDIDHYAMPKEEYYLFELESASGDADVKITPDGTLTIVETDSPHPDGNGAMLDPAIREFIAREYPGSTIQESDYDDGLLEVEIIHENRIKHLYFNGSAAWVRTEWDVRRDELPAAVESALAASEYGTWEIDDIEFVQTPEAAFYLIELESADDREAKIRISESGEIR